MKQIMFKYAKIPGKGNILCYLMNLDHGPWESLDVSHTDIC